MLKFKRRSPVPISQQSLCISPRRKKRPIRASNSGKSAACVLTREALFVRMLVRPKGIYSVSN